MDEIKQSLLSDSICKAPHPAGSWVIRTDASRVGLGSVLLQRIGGEERVICSSSRKLYFENCSTIGREMLSIIWSLQKYQDYIYARHVVVETDHRPFAYLKRLAHKSSRVARWALILHKFYDSTTCRKSALQTNCDALSRL